MPYLILWFVLFYYAYYLLACLPLVIKIPLFYYECYLLAWLPLVIIKIPGL